MTKKSVYKKRRLGRKLKQARRVPLLARLRSHRRIETNAFSRNWRRSKLRIKEE